MERPSRAPTGGEATDRPSIARVYDYYLGGSHNFAVDRAFAEQVLRAMPQVREFAHDNRAFLRRAVQFLSQSGIRQFIDLGSGIPTVGNVHEVAQALAPDTRVVYVDNDPVAVAHSRSILHDAPGTAVVAADLRRPVEVLSSPEVRRLIDFREPVGVMLVAVLHFVADDEHPADIVAGYAAATVPGSYVTISHAGLPQPRELTAGEQEALAAYRRSTTAVLRSTKEVEELFGDLTIVEPGVVASAMWRPETTHRAPDTALGIAGVGRKD